MNIITKYPELLKIYDKNTPVIKTRILKILNEPISNSDCIGWIYGFYSAKDYQYRNNFWIKLGRTERNPFSRINEWKGIPIFCIKTSYNHRAESLVHLFFNFSRENRTKTNRTNNFSFFTSFLKRLFCCFGKRQNEPLEIEWFHFKEYLNVQSLVCQICEMVEDKFDGRLLKKPSYMTSNILSNILSKSDKHNKININHADIEELLKIPLINKSLAKKIVKHRKMLQFTCIEEIKLVDHKFNDNYDQLKDMICI